MMTSVMTLRFLGEHGGVDGSMISPPGSPLDRRLGVEVYVQDRERVEAPSPSMSAGIGAITGKASASSSDSHTGCNSSSSGSDSTGFLALPSRFFVVSFDFPFFPVLGSSPLPCSRTQH